MWCNMLTSLCMWEIHIDVCQYTYANIHVVHIHTHPIACRRICTLVCICTHIRSCVYIIRWHMYIYLCIRMRIRTLTWVHPHMTDCVYMCGCVWCVWVCVCEWEIVRIGENLGSLCWEVYADGIHSDPTMSAQLHVCRSVFCVFVCGCVSSSVVVGVYVRRPTGGASILLDPFRQSRRSQRCS